MLPTSQRPGLGLGVDGVFRPVRGLWPALMAVLLVGLGPTADAASGGEDGPRVIEMKAVGGLQFDRKRFTVEPGAKVRLVLKNVDTMMHNLVITEPGGRMAVVNAALQMGKDGPRKGYIPESEKVLHGIEVLGPQQEKALEFTVPEEEGVYPYVCTFPGHGFIMYGAMYVTTEPGSLPELAEDPHVPDPDAAAAAAAEMKGEPGEAGDRVRVTRTFMPDSGPAAIAVGLPGGQNYCFDAGACYLRYAWRGGYIDDTALLESKGDGFAKILGRVYYRRSDGFPLRIGSNPDRPAQKRQWIGYELGEDAVTFRYRVDGVEIRERIEPRGEAGSGLVRRFELGPTDDRPVWFLRDPEAGAAFSASAGTWQEDRLKLTAEEAGEFTITMAERPGVAPLGYWSMNDELWKGSALPVKGVAGRALVFNGKNDEVATGIETEQLDEGATLSVWARVPDGKGEGTVIGAKLEGEKDRFALGYSEEKGYQWRFSAEAESGNRTSHRNWSGVERPAEWHHVTVVITDERDVFYVDGNRRSAAEKSAGVSLPTGELYIGSEGGKRHFKGQLDEVRVYDRALSGEEIRSLYEDDKRRPSRAHVIQKISE